jgi:peptidyl-prolyl cis-trans isomerase SurA
LIDEKVKIKEAKKFGVDPSSDIDQSYAGMSSRMRITPDQLTKSLESQGIRPETLKARIKAEMVWTSLVRGRFKESLQVGEKDVAAAVQVKGRRQAAGRGFEYKMQPIVLIVPRGAAPSAIEAGARKPKRCAPRADLRGGQRLLQVDAERRDPRDRHQDLGRHTGGSSRSCSTRRRSAI